MLNKIMYVHNRVHVRNWRTGCCEGAENLKEFRNNHLLAHFSLILFISVCLPAQITKAACS